MRRLGLREFGRPDSSGRRLTDTASRRPAARSREFRRSALVALFALFAVAACNENTRYRVLTFFFDGVPKPGEKSEVGYAADTSANFESDEVAGVPKRVERYPHTPYRNGDCGGCHDNTTGQLVASTDEGLCLLCHRGLAANLRYVHGPVAVNACTFCHHFHGSIYPGVLVADATELCLRCHNEGDVKAEPHHQSMDETACIDCHNAHGGADPYFLR